MPDSTKSRDFNRYSYAGNNPLTLIDPNGHQVPPACVSNTAGSICSTGTGGGYVGTSSGVKVEVALPQGQGLTVGTTQSKNDVVIKAAHSNPDDGVYIYVTHNARTFQRSEVGTWAGVDAQVASGSVEFRSFSEKYSDGYENSGSEFVVNGSIGFLGLERSSDGSASLNGTLKVSPFAEANVQSSGNKLLAGFSVKGPTGTGKASWYGGVELPGENHYIMSQEKLDRMGGLDGFKATYVKGGRIAFMQIIGGQNGLSGWEILHNQRQRELWYPGYSLLEELP